MVSIWTKLVSRHRQTDRQTGRQADRQADRQTKRQEAHCFP